MPVPPVSSSSHSIPAAQQQAYATIKMAAPSGQDGSTHLSVQNPTHWALARQSTGIDTPLSRATMAKPGVIEHIAEGMAQAHKRAPRHPGPPVSNLKTTVEAMEHWQDVVARPVLHALAPIEPRSALHLLDDLGPKLWSSTPERILCDYNSYPAALSMGEDGTVQYAPDMQSYGYHAWFEPLARLDYTSRTERGHLAAAVHTYAESRSDVAERDQGSWQLDALRCRTTFDLLYVAYFLKAAPQVDADVALKPGPDRDHYLVSLQGLIPRLQDDLQALQKADPSTPELIFLPKPAFAGDIAA